MPDVASEKMGNAHSGLMIENSTSDVALKLRRGLVGGRVDSMENLGASIS
jgi:hypothetical protein